MLYLKYGLCIYLIHLMCWGHWPWPHWWLNRKHHSIGLSHPGAAGFDAGMPLCTCCSKNLHQFHYNMEMYIDMATWLYVYYMLWIYMYHHESSSCTPCSCLSVLWLRTPLLWCKHTRAVLVYAADISPCNTPEYWSLISHTSTYNLTMIRIFYIIIYICAYNDNAYIHMYIYILLFTYYYEYITMNILLLIYYYWYITIDILQ